MLLCKAILKGKSAGPVLSPSYYTSFPKLDIICYRAPFSSLSNCQPSLFLVGKKICLKCIFPETSIYLWYPGLAYIKEYTKTEYITDKTKLPSRCLKDFIFHTMLSYM